MIKILIIALCLIAHPAFAQDRGTPETQTYDPSFSGRTNAVADQIRQQQAQSIADKGFIKPNEVRISIVHEKYMEIDQFGLQMAVPDVVSGCFDLTPLEYEANFIDPYFLDIKVKKYRRITPEGAINTASCERQNKMSTGLMVLSRKDLETRGTKEIRFSTESGRDTYKIVWDGNRLQLIPESMSVFKAQNMTGPLKDRIAYSFTGETTVALHVPMAQPGDDVGTALMQFAQMRALTPAEGGEVSANGQRVYYFTDNGGHVAGEIGPEGYGELGKISVGRPYDGAGGRKLISKELTVFVTRPGTQL